MENHPIRGSEDPLSALIGCQTCCRISAFVGLCGAFHARDTQAAHGDIVLGCKRLWTDMIFNRGPFGCMYSVTTEADVHELRTAPVTDNHPAAIERTTPEC